MNSTQSPLRSKAIKIQGTPYVQVKDRILLLCAQHADQYSITTSYRYIADLKRYIVRAELVIGSQTFTGHAQETESEDTKHVNHTSALENAETSAVGRACTMAGIGIVDTMPSAEEAVQTVAKAVSWPQPKAESTAPQDSRVGNCNSCKRTGPVRRLKKMTKYGASYVLDCACGEKTWLPVGRVKQAVPSAK